MVDINAFLKSSSAHREDYSKLEEITELPPHFFETFLHKMGYIEESHCSNSWAVAKSNWIINLTNFWNSSPSNPILNQKISFREITIRVSYWENAFKAFVLNFSSKIPKQPCIDVCWRKIGAIKKDSVQLKYTQLLNLAKCVLSTSHRKSVPEGGFSINKHLHTWYTRKLD